MWSDVMILPSLLVFPVIYGNDVYFIARNANYRMRLSMENLLFRLACFAEKKKNVLLN